MKRTASRIEGFILFTASLVWGGTAPERAAQRLSRRRVLLAVVAGALALSLTHSAKGAEPADASRGMYVERYGKVNTFLSNMQAYQFGASADTGLRFSEPLGFFRIDLQTGKAHQVVEPATFLSGRARLSPNGRYLACLARDKTLQVRDLVTQDAMVRAGADTWVSDFAWLPDGNRLSVLTWSTKTMKRTVTLEFHQLETQAGKTVLQPKEVIPAPSLWHLAPAPRQSPDGKWLAYERWGRHIRFGSTERPLQIPSDKLSGLRAVDARYWDPQWSPKNKEVLLLGLEAVPDLTKRNRAGLFITGPEAFEPVRVGEETFARGTGVPYGMAAWSPSGDRIAFQGRGSKTAGSPWGDIFVHDLTTGRSEQVTEGVHLAPTGRHRSVHWSADGANLFFVQSQKQIAEASAPRGDFAGSTEGKTVHQLEPWRLNLESGAMERIAEGYADLIIGIH